MTAPERAHLARGYTIALVSAMVLSLTGIFIRHLTQTYQMPALVLAFWRDGFVALTVLPILGLVSPHVLRVRRRHLLYLMGYGLMLAIFNASWTLSVALNGAAIATVLVYSSAAFTALLGWRLLKERLDGAMLAAVGLCLGGCVLASDALDLAAWRANVLGIVTGMLAGLMYSIYSLLGRSAAQRGLNPWATLLYTFGFATIFLFLLNLLPNGILPGAATCSADFFWLDGALAAWGVLFLLAAGPTVIGFGLYNVSLSYLPSSVANLILTLEPVFTIVVAYLLLGERLTGIQIVGSISILSGVLFLRVYEGWVTRPVQPKPHTKSHAIAERDIP